MNYRSTTYEQDNQQWAKQVQGLLDNIQTDVKTQGGLLPSEQVTVYGALSDRILKGTSD